MRTKIVAGAVVMAVFNSSLLAGLSWESTEQAIQPSAGGEVRAMASFPFRNVGKDPIVLTTVKTSCQCAAAVVEKKEYGPGEQGEVVMTISRRGRSGNQVATALVKTGDGKTVILTMKILAADFLKVKPPFVVWKRGESAAKELDVEVAAGAAVNKLTAFSTNPNFDITVDPVESGKRYRIHIVPKTSESPAVATFTIESDYPKERPGRIFAYGKIL